MKAKDLRGKNIEDMSVARADALEDGNEVSDKGDEPEDAVAAAYENISKRLESLRGGNKVEEVSDEESNSAEALQDKEIELEEWKGPKKPSKEDLIEIEEEEDTHELRKVKLRNLEEPEKNKLDQDEEIDPLDDEDAEEVPNVSKVPKVSKGDSGDEKEWEPEENDPLDEDEDESRSAKASLDEETAVEEVDVEKEILEDESRSGEDSRDKESGFESDNLVVPEDRRERLSESSDIQEERGRDVVASEAMVNDEFSESEEEKVEAASEDPDSLDDLAEEKSNRTIKDMAEDDYFIPKLSGSGQKEGDLGYNAHPQRGGIGESYSPRQNHMEGNNDPNSYFSQHQPQAAPKRANKFHLLILVLIGIAVIGFTVYILKGGFGELNIGSAAPSPSPSPVAATPEPTPTPTPEPDVERGDFSVRVLNGTSTSGLAKTISDKLKEQGYKTSGTGNASEDDVAQTEIRVKEGTESAALFERIKLDLAPDYEAIEGDALSKSAAYDAEVILGAK